MAGEGEASAFRFNFAFSEDASAQSPDVPLGLSADDTPAAQQETAGAVDCGQGGATLELGAADGLPMDASTLEQLALTPGLSVWKGGVQGGAAAQLVGNGGFKLWECAVDLAAYTAREWRVQSGLFTSSSSTDGSSDRSAEGCQPLLAGRRVLELGCGAGIPGIVALLAGAEVHFQDYNAEVIRGLTIPNVQANAAQLPGGTPCARYFAGAWADFGQYCSGNGLGGTYDVILTAETIYDDAGTRQLLQCIKECLKHPDGVAYVAAKSYYFGVGGSTAAFKELVGKDGALGVQHRGSIDDGVSNKRELLQLTWRQ